MESSELLSGQVIRIASRGSRAAQSLRSSLDPDTHRSCKRLEVTTGSYNDTLARYAVGNDRMTF